MSNLLIDSKDMRIKTIFACLERIQNALSNMKSKQKKSLRNETYIADKDLSERLKVCKRTLQEYRDKGLLPFYQLEGKILYKESDVQKLLESVYRKGFE